MTVNIYVLYNAESKRYTLLNCDTGETKQCKAATANALIQLFGKPIRKYFSTREDVQKYMKTFKR